MFNANYSFYTSYTYFKFYKMIAENSNYSNVIDSHLILNATSPLICYRNSARQKKELGLLAGVQLQNIDCNFLHICLGVSTSEVI